MGDFAFFNRDDLKNFVFYKFPKALFSDPRYRDISDSAKILYMIFYDRLTLSQENKFYDENGIVYIKYSIKAVMKELNWSREKVRRALECLEEHQLILQERPKAGLSYRIYVAKLANKPDEEVDSKRDQGGLETRPGVDSKRDHINKTKYNKTNYIDIYSARARVTQTEPKSKKNKSVNLHFDDDIQSRAAGDSS